MRYSIAVEDIEPSHYVAWALDLPGCFSRAPTAEEAIASAPQGIVEYFRWLNRHDPALPSSSALPTVEVVEVFQSFRSRKDPDYFVNAFFGDDRRPLTYWDIAIALNLLLWSREDLMQMIESLPHSRLHESIWVWLLSDDT
jgi:predicted RNase H-like HicB family nuclease